MSHEAETAELQNRIDLLQKEVAVLDRCQVRWAQVVDQVIRLPQRKGEISYLPVDDTLLPPAAYYGPFPALTVDGINYPTDCTM